MKRESLHKILYRKIQVWVTTVEIQGLDFELVWLGLLRFFFLGYYGNLQNEIARIFKAIELTFMIVLRNVDN